MNNTTMKYAKSVMQLEKGLPPNSVVPKLKEKVELMRERVRFNPCPAEPRYSRTSMAQTLMAHSPWLARTTIMADG